MYDFLADWTENGGAGGAEDFYTLLEKNVPRDVWYFHNHAYRFLKIKPEDLVKAKVAKTIQEATDVSKIDKNKFKKYVLSHRLGKNQYASWCWDVHGLSKEVSNQGNLYGNWLYFIKTVIRDGIVLEELCYWLKNTTKQEANNSDNSPEIRREMNDIHYIAESFIDDFGSNFEVIGPINSDIELYRIDSPNYYDEFGEFSDD